jgi:hypothetical protein
MPRPRLLLVCVLALLSAAPAALAQGWGTIKGRVTYAGDPPQLPPLQVNKDVMHCLKNGPIPDETWVVHPKSKGVRWVAVWLAVDKNGSADHQAVPPLHPAVAPLPAGRREAVLEYSCCKFEPHVLILRHGQTFVAKNDGVVCHNLLLTGAKGPMVNRLLKPEERVEVKDGWQPDCMPVLARCAIHHWMKAYVFYLSHPYFAVTDADGKFEIKNVPAGTFRLLAWHEDKGFILGDQRPNRNGRAITIDAGKTAELDIKITK